MLQCGIIIYYKFFSSSELASNSKEFAEDKFKTGKDLLIQTILRPNWHQFCMKTCIFFPNKALWLGSILWCCWSYRKIPCNRQYLSMYDITLIDLAIELLFRDSNIFFLLISLTTHEENQLWWKNDGIFFFCFCNAVEIACSVKIL